MPKPFAFFIRVLDPKKPGAELGGRLERQVLAPLCTDLGYVLRNGEDVHTTGGVATQIFDLIREADIVFVDGNNSNPNVWYEAGVADQMDFSKVLMLLQRGKHPPFDRAHARHFRFDQATSKDPVRDKLEAAMKDVATNSAPLRMLRNDDYLAAVTEWTTARPALASQVGRRLEDVATDIERSTEFRRRALACLIELGQLRRETCLRLSRLDVDYTIRQTCFEGISKNSVEVADEVWLLGLGEDKSLPVMRAVATAATKNWLVERVSDTIFERVVRAPRWETRKHCLLQLLREPSEMARSHVFNLCGPEELSEEVYNRGIEFVRKAVASPHLTGAQRVLVDTIRDALAASGRSQKLGQQPA